LRGAQQVGPWARVAGAAGALAAAAGACPSVSRYAITLARSAALGSDTGIDVPGTLAVELVRNASSVLSSHTSPDCAIAGEYVNPTRLPALRPRTSASDGPKPFFPTTAVWHDEH
jgi:hypothetical protein